MQNTRAERNKNNNHRRDFFPLAIHLIKWLCRCVFSVPLVFNDNEDLMIKCSRWGENNGINIVIAQQKAVINSNWPKLGTFIKQWIGSCMFISRDGNIIDTFAMNHISFARSVQFVYEYSDLLF